jgi:hypothetical protein
MKFLLTACIASSELFNISACNHSQHEIQMEGLNKVADSTGFIAQNSPPLPVRRFMRTAGKKLADIEHAEMTLDEKQTLADEAKIDALHLEDAVRFSTVSLEIYQDPGVRYTEIAKKKDIIEYQAPFISRQGASLSEGWQGFGDFLIFLCRYWIIVMPAAIGHGDYVRQFTRVKKIKIV